MKGTAASPGQVTGKALVLQSPTEISRVEPGTVLIASTTDPYWTPLFMHVVGKCHYSVFNPDMINNIFNPWCWECGE